MITNRGVREIKDFDESWAFVTHGQIECAPFGVPGRRENPLFKVIKKMKTELKYVSCRESGWRLTVDFDDGYGVCWWFYTKPTKAQIRRRKKYSREMRYHN